MAARKTSSKTKKSSASVFEALPEPIREALSIAATEIFLENIEAAVEDAAGLLEDGGLGSTYQGFHRGLITPKQLADSLEHLGPWAEAATLGRAFKHARADLTVGDFAGDLYDTILITAAVDMAEGILRTVIGEPPSPRVQPYADAIEVLAARLSQAIESGDSSEQDFNEEILG